MPELERTYLPTPDQIRAECEQIPLRNGMRNAGERHGGRRLGTSRACASRPEEQAGIRTAIKFPDDVFPMVVRSCHQGNPRRPAKDWGSPFE